MKRMAVPIVLIILISAAFVVLALPNLNLTPVQASAEGRVVDNLLDLELAVLVSIFILCMVFLFYSVAVFRQKKGESEFGEPFHENAPLEIAWTIIPVAICLWAGIYGAGLLTKLTDTQNYDMEVHVTAQQWSWSFEYPDTEITSAELVLPVDQKVLFTLESSDVIHSFWVPEFRLKQDVVPGMETHLIVTPSAVGDYKVRCAELCGLRHAYMLADVRVLEQADYDAWVAENTAPELPEDPVERGVLWAQQFGCVACHSTDGSVIVGPSWLGVYGEEVTLDDGSTVTADEDYIRESIMNPSAKLVDGFSNLMPPDFADKLSEDQINDLIAYIESLAE